MKGVGVIIKNGAGNIPSVMLEASVIVCTLELVQEMGFLNIEIKGDDALGIIKKLQDGTLVDEAKAMPRCFHSCSFMHTWLRGNMVAHCLAKYRLRLKGDVRVEEFLDFVKDCIINGIYIYIYVSLI